MIYLIFCCCCCYGHTTNGQRFTLDGAKVVLLGEWVCERVLTRRLNLNLLRRTTAVAAAAPDNLQTVITWQNMHNAHEYRFSKIWIQDHLPRHFVWVVESSRRRHLAKEFKWKSLWQLNGLDRKRENHILRTLIAASQIWFDCRIPYRIFTCEKFVCNRCIAVCDYSSFATARAPLCRFRLSSRFSIAIWMRKRWTLARLYFHTHTDRCCVKIHTSPLTKYFSIAFAH